MKKGFTLIELFIAIGIVGVIVLTMIAVIADKEQKITKEQEIQKTCERYKDYTIEKLPVKCLEYFQVNKLLTK